MKLPVYLVQLDCAWESKQANFDRVDELLAEEPPAAGSLIVLPEMFATGFSMNTEVTRQGPARECDGYLRNVAVRHQACVMGGVVGQAAEGSCQNQAVAFSPDGRELVRYAKIHPFRLGGEDRVHAAGEEVCVFPWGDFKLAPLVCYDLRFPELARRAVAAGADVLVYVASWPARRYQHWLTLLQARAIENLAYVIGVNRCGQDPNFTYPGRSIVVDPHGVIIADAGSQERVTRAVIDAKILSNWRNEFPALRDAGLLAEVHEPDR